MALRGFQLVAAMITVSELGAISRCANGHVRWLLTECAEHWRATRAYQTRTQGVALG
jgi:hypothetical protein